MPRRWIMDTKEPIMAANTGNYTPQELMVVCAARQIQDGEHVFVGMRLPLLAFALAKRTHAPRCLGLFEAGILRDEPAADIASLSQRLAIIMQHDRHRLREKVDYVTSPGYGYPGEEGPAGAAWRERVGLPGGGPSALITTLAVFGFDRENGEAVLQSFHPGTTVEEVQAKTGWTLRLADDYTETVPPSAEELKVIRECDPQGKWTR